VIEPGARGSVSAVERIVARTLWWGGLVSVAAVLLGLVLCAARGGLDGQAVVLARHPGAPPAEVFASIGQVLAGLRAQPMDPLAVIALGLLLLLATPVVGVLLAVPAFIRDGDRRYAAIAAAIFAMLAASIALAGGIG